MNNSLREYLRNVRDGKKPLLLSHDTEARRGARNFSLQTAGGVSLYGVLFEEPPVAMLPSFVGFLGLLG
jgi:hypothetical protein